MKSIQTIRNTILRTLIVSTLAIVSYGANAADHSEAPGTRADSASDIADLYAWHQDTKLNAIISFAGLKAPMVGQKGTYDEDVRYILHVDNNADQVADYKVITIFKQINNRWWMEVSNLPGASQSVLAEVENVTTSGSSKVYAGLRDDPFFFDFEGYLNTLATGTVSFDSTRDSFAGTNVTSIVLQMDISAAMGGNTGPLKIWATTERKK